jgi:hypothetical protein
MLVPVRGTTKTSDSILTEVYSIVGHCLCKDLPKPANLSLTEVPHCWSLSFDKLRVQAKMHWTAPRKQDHHLFLTIQVADYQFEKSLNWTPVPVATFCRLPETSSFRKESLFANTSARCCWCYTQTWITVPTAHLFLIITRWKTNVRSLMAMDVTRENLTTVSTVTCKIPHVKWQGATSLRTKW